MSIQIVKLTEENLEDAPEWPGHPFSCKYCVYWEFLENCVDPTGKRQEEMLARKLNWFRKTSIEFGACGKLLYSDGKGVGFAQYAPARFLPRSRDYQSAPVSPDAVLLSCLLIHPRGFAGQGLGTRLLESIVDELRGRGERAVETFARRGNPDNPSGPLDFHLKNGFAICRDDEDFPLMRLEL